MPINRHPQYYLGEGVVFRVGNTYFKIPQKELCLLSPVFDDLFTLPTSSIVEGVSDECPISLEKVSAIDFERLLTYLYPLTENSQNTKEWSFDYWHSVLKLAHQYMMESTCSEVIRILDKISFPDPLTMIQCGLKFDYGPWVRHGYSELVMRRLPLSAQEAEMLGYENAIRCAAARECYQTNKGNSVHWALDKWFTGINKLPPDPWEFSDCDMYLY